nr:hypothetical protein [Microbispora rosea]
METADGPAKRVTNIVRRIARYVVIAGTRTACHRACHRIDLAGRVVVEFVENVP